MAQERLTKCPLCKSGLFLNHSEIKDYSISRETFFLCQCTTCKLIFTNPRPNVEEIGQYYDSEDYISHKDKSRNLVQIIYKLVRKVTIRKKTQWLKKHVPLQGRLLDIGCGTGYFLKEAQNKGWKVTGIEPNDTARKLSKQKGLKVFRALEKIEEGEKFDAITLFHVIEHVHEIRKTAKKLNNILNKDGRIFMAVPNHQSYDAKYYGKFWAAWDVPRHLYHFDQESMNQMAEQYGWEIEKVIPMKFDSYYVSILSEKYKDPHNSGIRSFLKGLRIGYQSNHYAKNNSQNYSSLLFVLKKK